MSDPKRGDVSGLPRIVGVPVKAEKPRHGRAVFYSGKRLRGIPVEHLPGYIPPRESSANTSAAWAEERKERAEKSGTVGTSEGIPAHKLPGGETSLRGRLQQAAAAGDEKSVSAITAQLRREEQQAAAREVDVVERVTEPLRKPKKRRRRR